jgi:hypothetical protein
MTQGPPGRLRCYDFTVMMGGVMSMGSTDREIMMMAVVVLMASWRRNFPLHGVLLTLVLVTAGQPG